jgi:hypothetical protein
MRDGWRLLVEAALELRSRRLLKPKATSPQQLLDWKMLKSKIRKKYDKRNEVARSDISRRGMAAGSQFGEAVGLFKARQPR